MEPRIQYAQTADGVSIAFRTRGEEGEMPVVATPISPFGRVEKMYQTPLLRRPLYNGDSSF